jgi:glutathione S-transferase
MRAGLALLVLSCWSSSIYAFVCTMSSFTMPPTKPTLVDMPVSNFGSRCRFIVYTKELESTIDVVTPMEFGGLKTPGYLAVNPQGKMPALITEEGECFGESDVIARYLIERFAEQGPSFSGTLKDNTLANSLARQHDMYIGPIMGCLYKPSPPFGK